MSNNNDRKGRAKDVRGAFFPTPVAPSDMPDWYGDMLGSIKELIANGRSQVMWTANVQMSMMYYRIGQTIIQRQNSEGWGSKVVDRLSADLKKAFPEMHGFSPRNLKYMRRFAEVWPDETIVQRCVAQLPWRHNICLMEKVSEPNRRLNYENGSDHYSVRLYYCLKNDQKNRPLDEFFHIYNHGNENQVNFLKGTKFEVKRFKGLQKNLSK